MKAFALLAGLLAAAPAIAQPTPAPQPPAVAATVDAQRLALARATIDFIWPLGTYQRMMSSMMMDQMMGAMFDMKLGDLVPEGRSLSEKEKSGAQTTMREAIASKDPYFEERMRITNKVMMAEMGVVFTKGEPAIREGLASAYARKFTTEQLTDLNRFFATPTGRVYASESMMLFTDPELMKAMMAMMPELVKAMPAIVEKVKAATAHLPEPPKEKEELEGPDNA